MSQLVYASDLHGNADAYEALFALEADAVVLGGDLFPRPHRASDLLEPQLKFVEYLASKMAARRCYWIPGNDDWAAAAALLEGKGIPIHGRAVPFFDGYWIAGYGCVPVTPFRMKDFDRFDGGDWSPDAVPARCLRSGPQGIREGTLDDVAAQGTIAEDLAGLAGQSDPARTIYVIHSPPWRTKLDVLYDGSHVGSPAVRRFIEERRPPMTLHGHIHESPGVDRFRGTVCVNPGDSLQALRAVRVDLGDLSVTPVR
jgi:Icc-related predicted phosphoesterase